MSLASRIIIRLTLTSVIATGAAYGWLYAKQSHVDEYLRHLTLMQQAEEISRYMSINADGEAELNLPPQLYEAYNSSGSPYCYIVRDGAGRIVAISGRGSGPLRALIADSSEREESTTMAVHEQATFPVALGGRSYAIFVQQTASKVESLNAAVFDEFVTDGGWIGIPFLFALLGISAYTVRRSLAPLDQLSALAAKIDPGNSTVRLPNEGVPREIRPLVRAVNNALDRLDTALKKQRDFSANAAHQLRTPLAVLSANIEAMTDRSAAPKLRHDVDLMSRIVTQLLLVARLEALNIPLNETVDLRSCAQQAARNLGPLAVSGGKSLEVDEPELPVYIKGNESIVVAAVSNLVENALNYSPTGGVVVIRVSSGRSIDVLDGGPGVPLDMREKIFERFWRGENSETGAGLGLSIVRQIMVALNGTVVVSDAPGGGAKFSLKFPS
jgi:signal transduction histidine kinase